MEYSRFLKGHVFSPLTAPLMADGGYLTPSDMAFESFNDSSPVLDVDHRLNDMFKMFNINNISPVMNSGQLPCLRRLSGGQMRLVNEGLGQALTSHCSSGFEFNQNVYCGKKVENNNMNENGNNNNNINNNNVNVMSVWSLKELRGGIYKMAKDQNGCRILQAMLERSTMEEVEIMLCEVVNYVTDLMKDQFGNYLVQKLVVMCNDGQKLRLVLSLIRVPTDVIVVCMNPHGTRAVQKLLESLNANQVKLVVKALYRGAAALAIDPNGHHVIQYCLINFNSDVNKPILTEIANRCYKIATDRSGCCVLQACVEHTRGELRTLIIAEIITKAVHLAEDPFGNYVLQHMVGLEIPELTEFLVRQLRGNFAALSCNKYGSNVVEKCLNESSEDISTKIIMELISSPNAAMLLVDPYANFVIQSALKVSKGLVHGCLCALISKNTSSMRTNLYGKKILEKVDKKRVHFA